mmetsp:Transcript_15272/g.22382  ORF Transcript_15272/g.22382 Transcript_15272/m.22382 type:complete len:161 (+) Transcript_15272:69-551(+)
MSVNEVKIKPAPFELEVRGTGHPGSRTFAIGDEDHTLGNSLRHVLIQNSKIAFAGYSVPHPSEPVVHIRVQTAKVHGDDSKEDDDDDENSRPRAVDALKEACETLIAQCTVIIDQVEELMPEVRQDRMDIEDKLRNDAFAEGADEEMEEFDEMMDEGEEY